jgi:hypothetical protein
MMYCPSCRENYDYEGEQQPPYAAIHTMDEPPQHRHPITYELLLSAEESRE